MCDDESTTQTPDTTERANKRCRESTLPPCDICGHKASGLHYGVNSCEACKVQTWQRLLLAATTALTRPSEVYL